MEALAQRLGGEAAFAANGGGGMDWSDALLFHHTEFGLADPPARADGAAHSMSTPVPRFRPPARCEYSSTPSSTTASSAWRTRRRGPTVRLVAQGHAWVVRTCLCT